LGCRWQRGKKNTRQKAYSTFQIYRATSIDACKIIGNTKSIKVKTEEEEENCQNRIRSNPHPDKESPHGARGAKAKGLDALAAPPRHPPLTGGGEREGRKGQSAMTATCGRSKTCLITLSK